MPFFVSSNKYKFSEYDRIFRTQGVVLELFDYGIDELQVEDLEIITHDKIMKAYRRLHRPLIVEQASLSLEALGGLPEGFTKPFWQKLKDHICDIASALGKTRATMKTYLAYCDGQHFSIVHGEVDGDIAPKPHPVGEFHLDRVFIPDGQSKTLAEMSESERDTVSPRGFAVTELCKSVSL